MMGNSDGLFTIVLPIKNHSDFLERFLTYYDRQELVEPLFVADSSDETHVTNTKRLVEYARRRLNVEYLSFPTDATVPQKLAETLARVRTQFVVPAADDDFLIPAGLRSACTFLKNHSDFSVAHGNALIFQVEPGPVYGEHVETGRYLQRSIEHTKASERLLDHFSNYSTIWYSAHRTEDLARNMAKVASLAMERSSFTELSTSGLSIIRGKTKKLDVLYMVRQVHKNRREYAPDVFDLVISDGYPVQYCRLETCLSEELAREDRISMEAARAAVKKAFWLHLAQTLMRKWDSRYAGLGTSISKQIKNNLRVKVPAFAGIWRKIRPWLPTEDSRMLLPALLRSSSPFHADFMPVYRAIGKTWNWSLRDPKVLSEKN